MRAEQVLDMQVDLLRRFDQPLFVQVVKDTLGPAQSKTRVMTAAQRESNLTTMVQALRGQVRVGYAYRVTPDMSLVVQHAASLLDDTDRMRRDLLPTGCGIVRFDRPLPISDSRGKTMKAHWMTWGPIGGYDGERTIGGTLLSWWNDLADPDDITADWAKDLPKMTPILGRWSLVGAELLYDDQRLGPGMTDVPAEDAAAILADGDRVSPYTNTSRYAVALWMLLGQTVADVAEEHVRKTSARAARRMGIPDRVTVIQLRRTAGSRSEGETDVEWSHRWVVRGHWRWQPYGTHRAERRRIWIAPFVKGPEDKPLVVTDKVYDLRR